MPNEYISREAAQYKIREQNINPETPFGKGLSAAIDILQGIPSADVAPVVRSRIINVQEHNDMRFDSDGEPHNNYYQMGECENCGCEMFPEWKGCPVCLARMDGGEPHAG